MYIHLGISERLTHQLKIASLWVSKVSHSYPSSPEDGLLFFWYGPHISESAFLRYPKFEH